MLQIATGRFFGGAERYDCERSRSVFSVLNMGQLALDSIRLGGAQQVDGGIWSSELCFNAGLPKRVGGPRAGDRGAVGDTEIMEQFVVLLQVATERICAQDPSWVERVQSRQDWPLPSLLLPSRSVGGDAETTLTNMLSVPRAVFLKLLASSLALDRAVRAAEFSYDAAFANVIFAIEALVPKDEKTIEWEEYPNPTRGRLDDVLVGVDAQTAGRVRDALLDDRGLKATASFLSFAESALPKEYFGRADAAPRSHLRRVLKSAYSTRSGYVHALRAVERPATRHTYDRPMVWHAGHPHLTLQGAMTLAMELIRAVARQGPHAPTESNVQWQDELPGVVRMRLADQYWLHLPAAYTKDTIRQRFADVASHLVGVLAGAVDEPLLDLRQALEATRKLMANLPNERKGAAVGLVTLWHHFAPTSAALPWAPTFLAQNESFLNAPSPEVAVLDLLRGRPMEWFAVDADTVWRTYLQRRYGEKSGVMRLSPSLEAGVLAEVANLHLRSGDSERFRALCADLADDLGSRPAVRSHVCERRDSGRPLDVRFVLGLQAG